MKRLIKLFLVSVLFKFNLTEVIRIMKFICMSLSSLLLVKILGPLNHLFHVFLQVYSAIF